MPRFPKLICSQSRFLAAAILFISPILAQQSAPPTKLSRPKQPPSKTSVLLVDTDDTCRLLIDDEDKGVLSPDHSQKFSVTIGEHILKCTVEAVPDLVWRKVVEVKDTSQVAAVVALKALHIQYDAALAKAKSQKDGEEAASAKKLAEAEATRRAEEKAKADLPQQVLNQLRGRWRADAPWQGLKGDYDEDTVAYTLHFNNLGVTQAIFFSLEWEHSVLNAYGGITAFGHSYKASFQPTMTGRFQAVPYNCVQAVWVPEGKAGGRRDWTPCSAVGEGFGPGIITILSENQLQMETCGLRLTFTRE
jgi:hypothetical protein